MSKRPVGRPRLHPDNPEARAVYEQQLRKRKREYLKKYYVEVLKAKRQSQRRR